MIDLRRLRVLRALAEYGTLTAAAHALYLTPSAASQQVRQLGKELGVTLLEPHGRHVYLTPKARELLHHAEAIEQCWEQAQARLHADAPPSGELRVCGITTAVSALLAPAAVTMRERFPEVRMRIVEAEPPACFDLLFRGAVDLAVTMATPESPPLEDPGFESLPLLEDPYDLLTAPEHPLAGADRVRLADLAREQWVLGMPETAYRQTILALCGTAGFTPDIAHEVFEWSAVAGLAGRGLGIALLPRLVRLPAEPAVVRTPLADPAPSRPLLTVTRRGAGGHPLITAALTVLRELC
ncbi:LysR substrate-binding domain-containing protein [Sciscionella marina]|uniref:LysR substrate-binding domain-containing protein n=1 Tax=Sciscionella marina TaxID=508770 RepID=UPI00035EB78D|nr:LysR substrate-binding domain-containing protein [Sciscionella marina]